MPRSQPQKSTALHVLCSAVLFGLVMLPGAVAAELSLDAIAARLNAAYPSHITGRDGNDLLWTDGTRMPLRDGGPQKSFAAWLATPDIADMFTIAYPVAQPLEAPAPNADPGRARNGAFFKKIYGDCSKGEVTANLVDVDWLPRTAPAKLKVSRINGVAGKLQAVSRELDTLGERNLRFLSPPAGTYNCRPIAGTDTLSAHGYGIAIDIAVKHAHYWRWQKPSAANEPVWRNDIPAEIVAIFEKHGFIWGGRWHHYDTMHFEYRPELLPPASPSPPQ